METRAVLCDDGFIRMANIHPVIARLARGATLVMEAESSTCLARLGYHPTGPLGDATVARDAPDVVAMAHREAIVAGADIVASFTHGTTVRVLSRGGFSMRASAMTHRALDLAQDEAARADHPVLVAATLGPLGIERDRIALKTAHEEHREQVERLVASNAELLFVEAMPTLAESIAATAAASGAAHCPVWVVIACRSATHTEDGIELALALKLCAAAGAQLVILSANSLETLLAALETAETCGSGLLFGVRIHVGTDLSPERFAVNLVTCVGRGARVVGGFGAVTASHTRTLVEFVRARRAA